MTLYTYAHLRFEILLFQNDEGIVHDNDNTFISFFKKKRMTLNLTDSGFVIIDIKGNKCNQTNQIHFQVLICRSIICV